MNWRAALRWPGAGRIVTAPKGCAGALGAMISTASFSGGGGLLKLRSSGGEVTIEGR